MAIFRRLFRTPIHSGTIVGRIVAGIGDAVELQLADVITFLGTSLMPTGGTAGQHLEKASGTDYDTIWATPSSAGLTHPQVMVRVSLGF